MFSALGVGFFGMLIAIFPSLWVDLFTSDASGPRRKRAVSCHCGTVDGVLAVGISLYFSSQGAAKVLGSVVAQTARLGFVVAAGSWLTASGAGYQTFSCWPAAPWWCSGCSPRSRCGRPHGAASGRRYRRRPERRFQTSAHEQNSLKDRDESLVLALRN